MHAWTTCVRHQAYVCTRCKCIDMHACMRVCAVCLSEGEVCVHLYKGFAKNRIDKEPQPKETHTKCKCECQPFPGHITTGTQMACPGQSVVPALTMTTEHPSVPFSTLQKKTDPTMQLIGSTYHAQAGNQGRLCGLAAACVRESRPEPSQLLIRYCSQSVPPDTGHHHTSRMLDGQAACRMSPNSPP